jgi:hypothetical protein
VVSAGDAGSDLFIIGGRVELSVAQPPRTYTSRSATSSANRALVYDRRDSTAKALTPAGCCGSIARPSRAIVKSIRDALLMLRSLPRGGRRGAVRGRARRRRRSGHRLERPLRARKGRHAGRPFELASGYTPTSTSRA